MNNDTTERELDWNDTISDQGGEFVLLPAGEYPFTIKTFERARHAGSEKLPPCQKAVLHVEIDGGKHGKMTLKNNLFLHTKTQGLLAQFFKSIGAEKKSDGQIKMDWNTVPGAKGRCKIKQTPGYKDSSKTYNEIDRFLEPTNLVASNNQGFTKGEF